jgi:hypothetical protein
MRRRWKNSSSSTGGGSSNSNKSALVNYVVGIVKVTLLIFLLKPYNPFAKKIEVLERVNHLPKVM